MPGARGRLFPPRTSHAEGRRINVAATALTEIFIVAGGSTSPHYLVLATVELVLLALILRQSWRWRVEAV